MTDGQLTVNDQKSVVNAAPKKKPPEGGFFDKNRGRRYLDQRSAIVHVGLARLVVGIFRGLLRQPFIGATLGFAKYLEGADGEYNDAGED